MGQWRAALIGIHQCRDRTDFGHAKPGHDVFRSVLHEETYNIALPDPRLDPPARVLVGPCLKLRIGDRAVLEQNGDGMGSARRNAPNDVNNGQRAIGFDMADVPQRARDARDIDCLAPDCAQKPHSPRIAFLSGRARIVPDGASSN